MRAKYVTKEASFEEFHKVYIDRIVAKTHEQRKGWFEQRVKIMQDSLAKAAKPAVVKKGPKK